MTGEAREAHISAFRYVIVWLALMALALASYLLSRAHLGSLDIVLALLIALAKTTLVVLFFMELVEHRFVNALILLVSASLAVLLLVLMSADVVTRHTFPKGPLPVVDQTAHQ
jgi:cytochrome c oxidase subunit 4